MRIRTALMVLTVIFSLNFNGAYAGNSANAGDQTEAEALKSETKMLKLKLALSDLERNLEKIEMLAKSVLRGKIYQLEKVKNAISSNPRFSCYSMGKIEQTVTATILSIVALSLESHRDELSQLKLGGTELPPNNVEQLITDLGNYDFSNHKDLIKEFALFATYCKTTNKRIAELLGSDKIKYDGYERAKRTVGNIIEILEPYSD